MRERESFPVERWELKQWADTAAAAKSPVVSRHRVGKRPVGKLTFRKDTHSKRSAVPNKSADLPRPSFSRRATVPTFRPDWVFYTREAIGTTSMFSWKHIRQTTCFMPVNNARAYATSPNAVPAFRNMSGHLSAESFTCPSRPPFLGRLWTQLFLSVTLTRALSCVFGIDISLV